jgi:hypothetical protein
LNAQAARGAPRADFDDAHAAAAGNAGNSRNRRRTWVHTSKQEMPVAIAHDHSARALAQSHVARSVSDHHLRALHAVPALIDDLPLDLARLEQVDIRQAEGAIRSTGGGD